MAYTRTFETIVPVEPDVDRDVLHWLTRESFERQAESLCLVIKDYTYEQVDPIDLPPQPVREWTGVVKAKRGRAAAEIEWWKFVAVAEADPVIARRLSATPDEEEPDAESV